MLKVAEIFYSIQGEGYFSGVASIFIRLHGCNLSCDFCDDLKHKGDFKEYSYEEVLDKIKEYPSKRVIITGGEPTIYDLKDFIEALHVKDYFVAVETNGFRFENIKNADWITYSPKDWDNIKTEGFDEVKFILSKESDIRPVLDFESDKPIYIQPMNFMDKPNRENVDFCIDFVLKNPNFKLSVQLHKYLGVA